MFHCFDHAIRSDRGNSQSAPKIADGLVVRRIYLAREAVTGILETGCRRKLCDLPARLDPCRMNRLIPGVDNLACGTVHNDGAIVNEAVAVGVRPRDGDRAGQRIHRNSAQ